ncbi:hypothetical protein TNCV_5082511 [Trichonephila clavipes]|nr:hypothetical protein TNCV_5082511 [Trichonephila clavipes]
MRPGVKNYIQREVETCTFAQILPVHLKGKENQKVYLSVLEKHLGRPVRSIPSGAKRVGKAFSQHLEVFSEIGFRVPVNYANRRAQSQMFAGAHTFWSVPGKGSGGDDRDPGKISYRTRVAR